MHISRGHDKSVIDCVNLSHPALPWYLWPTILSETSALRQRVENMVCAFDLSCFGITGEKRATPRTNIVSCDTDTNAVNNFACSVRIVNSVSRHLLQTSKSRRSESGDHGRPVISTLNRCFAVKFFDTGQGNTDEKNTQIPCSVMQPYDPDVARQDVNTAPKSSD